MPIRRNERYGIHILRHYGEDVDYRPFTGSAAAGPDGAVPLRGVFNHGTLTQELTADRQDLVEVRRPVLKLHVDAIPAGFKPDEDDEFHVMGDEGPEHYRVMSASRGGMGFWICRAEQLR